MFSRLGGIELMEVDHIAEVPASLAPAGDGELVLASFAERRDWTRFADAYARSRGGRGAAGTGCSGCADLPRADHYKGQDAVAARHRRHEGAMEAAGVKEGFLNSVAPGELRAVRQRVLRDRRGAAVRLRRRDARGVQGDHRRGTDAPARRSGGRRELGHDRPRAVGRGLPSASRCSASRRSTTRSADLPPDRIRFHLCWGTLARAAHDGHPDARHRRRDARRQRRLTTRSRRPTPATSTSGGCGSDVKLPDGKRILPGVVTHATNVVEHPELVARADRALCRAASAPRT